jgi:hypothetical protein
MWCTRADAVDLYERLTFAGHRQPDAPPMTTDRAAVTLVVVRARLGHRSTFRYAAEAFPMPALSKSEIDLIEREIGATLPGLYRRLLSEFGPGEFGDLKIYHPIEIRRLYEPFFDDHRQLFNPYFPFGCHNGHQELWIIDASSERAATVWHETVPDDWGQEDWLSYDNWIQRYLAPQSGSFGSQRGAT